MAEANVFSPRSSLHHQRQHSVSVFTCKLNCKSALASSAIGFPSLKFRPIALRSSSNSDFHGRRIVVQRRQAIPTRGYYQLPNLQMSIAIGKAQKWWEKGVQSNMKEITGAKDLVDSLLNAGDKLVVVDFFSPGCGGCKALHPKICQLAEMNPDVQFLQVNYEEHKSMCYTLNVHVLPFFRFYRGAHGRVCSFSCTNATIKKFKDALAKYSPDCCSLGPPKGLEEKELNALSSNKDLCFSYTPKPDQLVPARMQEKIMAEKAAEEAAAAAAAAATTLASSSKSSEQPLPLPLPLPLSSTATERAPQDSEEKALVSSGR